MGLQRQVIKRAPQLDVGWVSASWFLPEPIEHEGLLEKSMIELLLVTPMVGSIAAQALKLPPYGEGSRAGEHTLDFLVDLTSGERIAIEVKPKRKVNQYIEKFNRSAQVLREMGMTFYVCTNELLTKSVTKRTAYLREVARRVPDLKMLNELLAAIANEPVSIKRLRELGINDQVIDYAIGRRLATLTSTIFLSDEALLCLVAKADISAVSIDDWLNEGPWIKK